MHIDFLRLLDRRDHSPEPTHRAQANVQVQLLPQRDNLDGFFIARMKKEGGHE